MVCTSSCHSMFRSIISVVAISLTGCAYTLVSTASYVTTGKSIGDHAASLASQNSCDTVKFASRQQDYYCEQAREPGTTYNRNSF